MTNRLELNWKLDGFVDEQRYYCSEIPIDPENLPVPKAVLAGDVRSYVDTAIDTGKTYYVAVGSVKNGVEKLSTQETADARVRYVHLIAQAGVLSDTGSLAKTWVNTNVLLANDVLNFSGSGYLETTGFDFTGDFEVSAFIKIPATASKTTFPILTNISQYPEWSSNIFVFAVGGQSSSSAGKLYFESANSELFMRSTTVLSRDVEYKVGFRKNGAKLQLLINDNVEQEITYSAITYKNYLCIGAFKADSNQRFVGSMRDFEIIQL